ncbi:MAG TPA: hypothetical protein VKV33_10770 [Streptosporangiaceae bacterium]|nr:hypothetical protein [Streptosporangiaceae bacterium]
MDFESPALTGPDQRAPSPAEHPPAGYTLVLPPGWEQIPVRAGTDEAISAILEDKFRNLPKKLPRDKLAPYRAEVEGRLRKLAADARRNGAVDLYMPVEFRRGTPIAASFIVAEGSAGTAGTVSAGQLVTFLAGEAGGGVVTVDGSTGVRSEQVSPPDPGQDIEFGSRRVDYVLPVPAQDDRWLVFGFSALGAGDPDDGYAKLLVQLFDAIMSTFRWTTAETEPPEGDQ